jgi:hypothetical protein
MLMFEQELEMEKRESSVVPLLLIVLLIISVVGVAGYYVVQSRKVLTTQEAADIAATILKAQGPATLHFHTGMIKGSVDEKPNDPHYRLLEKAGLIKLGKGTGQWGTTIPVALTPKGQNFLKQIQGLKQSKDADGTDSYVVPLAERKLVAASNINMITPSRATVDLTWKWEPNQLGEMFDASGPAVKSFNTWDRATLIRKYGANFYHGQPTKVTLALVKTERGWQIATE